MPGRAPGGGGPAAVRGAAPRLAGRRRILVCGANGAGKSTLADRLGAWRGCEVVHLDLHAYRPGWAPLPRAEFIRLQQRMVAGERWIIDGNHLSTFEVRAGAADAVLLLDLPPPCCLWRVVRRALRARRQPRTDLPPGCPERLDRSLLRFLYRTWTFRRRVLPRLEQRLAALAPGTPVLRLRSAHQVQALLQEMGRGGPG